VNFLAHCLIGACAGPGDNPGLVAGGFLGDFIKGRVPEDMPRELARGVRLHRRIDAYSNRHADIRLSCERFPPELRRLAPILVDIICDHLLARAWSEFHSEPLPEFTAQAYAEVANHGVWLPESGHRFLRYAQDRDLFTRYQEWAVTSAAMRSITRRLGRSELNDLMDSATPPLLEALEADFRSYFPDMLNHAVEWVSADSES